MVCVITGDVIDSRNLIDTRSWLKPLKTALSKIGSEPKEWEIFRGDSFQVIVKDVSKALHTAIRLKAQVRSKADVNLRLGMGIGSITYISEKVTESNGKAFIRSGEVFDQLKKNTIAIKSPWSSFDAEMNLYLSLASLTIDQWSVASAKAFLMQLENRNLTQREIAKRLGITQGRVSERLKRAGADEIHQMIDRYEILIKQQITSS